MLGVEQADAAELAGGELDERVVRGVPQLVPGEAEVLDAEAGEARARHPRAPRAEVLDATGARPGVVEVDPVVRERLGVAGHEPHDDEVAVAEPAGGGDDVVRRQRVERRGRARRAGCSRRRRRPAPRARRPGPTTTIEVDAPLGMAKPRHAGLELDRDAGPLEVVGDRLPHLARPEARVVELLDEARHVRPLEADRGGQGGPEREVRIRWAAHSDWISLPGIPQTFSVYSRKNAL